MRDKCVYAGRTVKTKPGVGYNLDKESLEERDFTIEDWFENVVGVSWKIANGHPTALMYAFRLGMYGENNIKDLFSDDVVYGKIDGLGYAFHIDELELDMPSVPARKDDQQNQDD